jgi:antirestriction protein ArdC
MNQPPKLSQTGITGLLKLIYFDPGCGYARSPKTHVIHQAAHELIHQGDNRAEAKKRTRSQRELEAESTAYVVMRHFGIEHVASNYLATYNVDGEQLRSSLETISGAAKRLIAAIEGVNAEPEDALAAVP